MLKLYPTLLFILCTLSAWAQEAPDLKVDEVSKDIVYADSIAVPGASQATLYALGKTWMSSKFQKENPKLSIKEHKTGMLVDEPEKFMFVGKTFNTISYTSTMSTANADLRYAVVIRAYEGAYSYKISRVGIQSAGDAQPVSGYFVMHFFAKKGNGKEVPWRMSMRRAAAAQFEAVVADLKSNMNKADF